MLHRRDARRVWTVEEVEAAATTHCLLLQTKCIMCNNSYVVETIRKDVIDSTDVP